MGGEVYSGIAIFNALRGSKADVNIYIDGIAASIASVIASCGKPVHMSRYARLMVHSVSGGCYGNKDEIRQCVDEIESLEETLADIYAARCKKTKDEIKQLFSMVESIGSRRTRRWRWDWWTASMILTRSRRTVPRGKCSISIKTG